MLKEYSRSRVGVGQILVKRPGGNQGGIGNHYGIWVLGDGRDTPGLNKWTAQVRNTGILL